MVRQPRPDPRPRRSLDDPSTIGRLCAVCRGGIGMGIHEKIMLRNRRVYKASQVWASPPQGRFLALFRLGAEWSRPLWKPDFCR